MIERGQCFVRAIGSDNQWHSVDILDLTEDSFRRFVLTRLHDLGAIVVTKKSVKEQPLYEQRKEND